MSKKKQKGHRCKSPQGGWGMGSKEPIQKKNLFIFCYNISELKNQKLLGPYIGSNQVFTTLENFWVFNEKGDPWGALNAPETTSDRRFLFFLSEMIKDRDKVRITYAQRNFKSTFGSAYLISKKRKLKLAKQEKRNQGKQAFLGILACCLCSQ